MKSAKTYAEDAAGIYAYMTGMPTKDKPTFTQAEFQALRDSARLAIDLARLALDLETAGDTQ